MVPAGEIPRELVGVKHSHFTVLPISDLTGALRFVAIIFSQEKLTPALGLGVDVFVEWDDTNFANNFGPGKRHPGLSLYNADGSKVPVYFDATPNASMTSEVLKNIFQKMDDLGIDERGFDEDDNPFCPAYLIEGHISRMGEDFLQYVNDAATRWEGNLGAPYGTDIWQYHDDTRMNGSFKMELGQEKSKFILKKKSTRPRC